MNNYSITADMLNKFHTADPLVQVIVALFLFATLALTIWCIKDILVAFATRRRWLPGELVYSIRYHRKHEWLLFRHGNTQDDDEVAAVVTTAMAEHRQ